MSLELISEYGPSLLFGLMKSLQLVLISVIIGGLLALPIAAGKLSSNKVMRNILDGYTYLFRGTPLLAQIFLLYYGAGKFRHELEGLHVWWIFRDSFTCAVLAFSINTAAYQAEIWRGAIQAIPKGQWEASFALGISSWTHFIRVALPQATLIALRPLGNEVVLMLKASSIASIITVPELLTAAGTAYSRTFDFQIYVYAALLYLVLVETVRRLLLICERRLSKHMHFNPIPSEKGESSEQVNRVTVH
ncbi:ABC transporter permease [Acerihabitans arboris]|uniref:Arginine ABC transporter permease protein ArtM n=1 Tax=Acerihabitans arboris TaxID=2691583 RepID=A0A845STR3_9GAMM|nr:ABC transporter permease subunit [Acerihabitans arboris]NDL65861.1 ABC transporter permease subunit [Acerihabitans arboris]